MKKKHLILCAALLCVLCIASLGILGVLEFDRNDLRVSVTLESRSITGINGGSTRHLTLGRHSDMADDYVQLAEHAPIWYTNPDNRVFVYFSSQAADAVTAQACDAHGNVQDLHCAQNIVQLPQTEGPYTIGVWAKRGQDTALYAFRVHIVED